MKVYLTNRQANVEDVLKDALKNKNEIRKRCHFCQISVDISDNQIHKTSNCPGKLKLCISVRVVLTASINTPDRLINWSTGKIGFMRMSRAGNNLFGIIYVMFDDVDAGNSLKNNLLGN